MAIELPALPYDRTALEPHISAETIDFHYSKHHQAYVTNLNNLIKGTEYENLDLEAIIKKAPAGGIYNNSAQVWNHTFFWNIMGPDAGGAPVGALADAISATFGSFDEFKAKFIDMAERVLGEDQADELYAGSRDLLNVPDVARVAPLCSKR